MVSLPTTPNSLSLLKSQTVKGTNPCCLPALMLIAGLAVPTSAQAENFQLQIDPDNTTAGKHSHSEADENHWTVGLGVGLRQSIYANDEDIRISPLPLISYDNGAYHIGARGFAYDVYQEDNLTLTAMLTPRLAPSFPDDDPLFDGIDRNFAVEAGASIQYEMRTFYVAAQGLIDISTAHDGYEINVKAGRKMNLGFGFLDVSAGGIFQDDNLSTYLYGVEAAEANGLRQAYSPKGEWRPFVNASLMVPLKNNISLLAATSYKPLSDSIQDSPLIDADAEFQTTFGVMYKF